MKIGIQILAYNCESTFEKLIEPWVKLKEQYDIKIWVGSGQFKIYNDMGCENLNGPTIKLLGKLFKKGQCLILTGRFRIGIKHTSQRNFLFDN